jgi:anti-sigma factor RsiW
VSGLGSAGIGGGGRGSHLGDIVTALIDGELGVEARDRALSHAAGCARCKAELDAERFLKATLRGIDAPSAWEPSLLESLLGIPESPTPRWDDAEAHHGARRIRHPYLVGAGCAASVVLGFAGAAALGTGATNNGRLVSPAVSTYTVENAATTGEVPLTDADLQAAVTVAFRGR